VKTRSKVARAQSSELRSQRRQKIVEAASRLFAQLGYADCDMDRVATRLRIAKGTIYLYFASKQELFLACVDHGMTQLQQAVRAAEESTADPFDRIARAIGAYLTFFAEHPQHVELLIQERAIFKNRKRPTYFEYRDVARAHWREFYQHLIEQGRLRSDINPDALLDTIGNLVYGTMFTNHFLGNRSVDEQQRHMLDIVFRGILSDEERKRLS
jgi:AcrR family transcriptional regulator